MGDPFGEKLINLLIFLNGPDKCKIYQLISFFFHVFALYFFSIQLKDFFPTNCVTLMENSAVKAFVKKLDPT